MSLVCLRIPFRTGLHLAAARREVRRPQQILFWRAERTCGRVHEALCLECAVSALRRRPRGLRLAEEVQQLPLSELSERCVGTLGSQRRIASKAALALGAGPKLEQQPKLILPINGDAARGINLPDLAVYYDGASCHQAERLRGREYNPESLSEAENLQPQSVHSRARDCELHRNCAGQAPQTGDRVLLLELRRRSDLAPLALATCLGEERREHRLHRPRLAFRAGRAPLSVLADRLLVAEALPALGAAVLVDRHKRREVIPARNGGQERGVYLPNGLRIGATVKPFTNASLPQYGAPSAPGVR